MPVDKSVVRDYNDTCVILIPLKEVFVRAKHGKSSMEAPYFYGKVRLAAYVSAKTRFILKRHALELHKTFQEYLTGLLEDAATKAEKADRAGRF